MITLTEQALAQVKKNLAKRGKGKGIQIGVRTTGCSGLAYTLEYCDGIPTDNNLYHIEGTADCMIVSDRRYEHILNGLVIDYVKQGLNEGFDFINDKERDRCGCGESFRI